MIMFMKVGSLEETRQLKEVRARDKTIVVDALKLTDVLKGDTEEFVNTTLSAFLDRRFLLHGIDTAGIIITTVGNLLTTSRMLLELRINEGKELSDQEKKHLEHIKIVTEAMTKEDK